VAWGLGLGASCRILAAIRGQWIAASQANWAKFWRRRVICLCSSCGTAESVTRHAHRKTGWHQEPASGAGCHPVFRWAQSLSRFFSAPDRCVVHATHTDAWKRPLARCCLALLAGCADQPHSADRSLRRVQQIAVTDAADGRQPGMSGAFVSAGTMPPRMLAALRRVQTCCRGLCRWLPSALRHWPCAGVVRGCVGCAGNDGWIAAH